MPFDGPYGDIAEKYGFIYRLTNRLTGKSYIGKTSGHPSIRFAAHVRASLNGTHTALSRAIRKHGADAFTVTIIDTAMTRVELNRLEVLHIHQAGCIAPHGYNLTIGGDGGRQAAEVLAVMSQKAKTRRLFPGSGVVVNCGFSIHYPPRRWLSYPADADTQAAILVEVQLVSRQGAAFEAGFAPGGAKLTHCFRFRCHHPGTRKEPTRMTAKFADASARAIQQATLKARYEDPELRMKISDAVKAAFSDPTMKARQQTASQAAFARPEVLARRNASITAAANQPHRLAAFADHWSGLLSDPEWLVKRNAAITAASNTPESKERHRAAAMKRASDPDIRRKIGEASAKRWTDPAYRELQRTLLIARHAQRTPEQKAAIAAKIKASKAATRAAKLSKIANAEEVSNAL